jgi:hypothetical protein
VRAGAPLAGGADDRAAGRTAWRAHGAGFASEPDAAPPPTTIAFAIPCAVGIVFAAFGR